MITWMDVLRRIMPGLRVPYYARSRKTKTGEFEILDVSSAAVSLRASSGGLRRISRANFEAVAEVWEDYKRDRIPRTDVPTFNSSYILSLLHLLEQATLS